MFNIKKYTLKENILSVCIAVIILIIIFCIKVHIEPEKVQDNVVTPKETYYVRYVQVKPAVPKTPKYEVYEMTEQDLAEEAYYDSLEMLAICVEAEAGNQGLLGKRMVADVILNRVDDSSFPDNIVDVISQPNQFTSYWDGGMERHNEPSEETIKAVQMEIEHRSYPSLLYFNTGNYSEYGTPWKQVGDHYFSTK